MSTEASVQLVLIRPKYQFRDGQARAGTVLGAANFARRGPWPIINILRTSQVRAAQKGVSTGDVYQYNEERLAGVEAQELGRMLNDRDWDALPVCR